MNISLFSKQGACDMALGVIDDWRGAERDMMRQGGGKGGGGGE